MNIAIETEVTDGAEPLWLSVSRLGAGFRHMEALAGELVTLDTVNGDIWQTHSAIRRDIANAVLQTAFVLKDKQEKAAGPCETATSGETVDTAATPAASDMWAKRLVRWADRFGRDLFGQSNAPAPADKKSPAVLPPRKS
jgi:hypothetical protein